MLIMPCLLTLSLAIAADPAPVGPPPNVPPKLVPLPTPSDAQAAALADLKAMPAGDRVFTRFIWHRDGSKVSTQLASLTTNYVSRSGIIYPVPVVRAGQVVLSRIDLRRIAPLASDLAEYLTIFEDLAFDPSFSTILTRDMIAQEIRRGQVFAEILEVGVGKLRVRCKPFRIDGQEFDSRWVAAIRLLSTRHLDAKVETELQQLTGSLAPVVEANYYTFRALSTIRKALGAQKDNSPFDTLWGGRYYNLAAIRKSKDPKKTDEDLIFESVGIGDVAKGITAAVLFDRLRSDRRTAMFQSLVTKKPRRIDIFPTLAELSGVLLVTHDLADEDVDVGNSPIKNLVNFKDAARELIFTGQNGLHRFALTDANGNLQDEAPPQVVKDHLIPPPNTARLAGAISCIRCHGVGGDDGLKPLPNDVQTLLKRYNVFGDVGKESINKTIPDVIDRLARQYTWRSEDALSRSRADYIKAILIATGPWDAGKDQTEVGRLSAQAYETLWQRFWYNSVDAQQALVEMGYGGQRTAKEAVELFNKLLPPEAESEVLGIIPEDASIGGLAVGLKISRSDWGLAYSPAMARAQKTEAARAKEKTP